MRLWSQKLLPVLCQQHILGQHRECCALRGDGWEKDHETVQYALNAPKYKLVAYHWLMMERGADRFGINFSEKWEDVHDSDERASMHVYKKAREGNIIYPEHADMLQDDIQDLHERSADPEHGCECDIAKLEEVA